MNDTKPKILVIVGPTASGKTSLSIKLAQDFAGEIISADSRQIYKTLNIGTGKVTQEEMCDIPHHLIDIVDPEDTYNADDFKTDASKAISEVISRGHLPLIAGGTFFYVDTLLGRITSPNVPPNPGLRHKLEAMSTEELYSELRERDQRRADEMDPQNKRRLVRALEIVSALGKVPQVPTDEPYEVLTIGIKRDKDELRARFRKRALEWLEAGFMNEIKKLLDSGMSEERLQEIGFEYTLAVEFYKKEITQDEFLQKFVEKNWQYAKRQITWLKRNDSIHWFESNEIESITSLVTNFIKNEEHP